MGYLNLLELRIETLRKILEVIKLRVAIMICIILEDTKGQPLM